MLVEIPGALSNAIGELELVPPDDLVRAGLAEADLRLLFGKVNKIIVQDVFVQPFTDEVAPEALKEVS